MESEQCKVELRTRDEFREGVFARDKYRCVICGAEGKDAHHIMERRLFDDGGYYLDNGATLCEKHHLEAEQTAVSCEEIRAAAGIATVVLPDHLYPDERWDKWGNMILKDGRRIRGELFNDESVQKILARRLAAVLEMDQVSPNVPSAQFAGPNGRRSRASGHGLLSREASSHQRETRRRKYHALRRLCACSLGRFPESSDDGLDQKLSVADRLEHSARLAGVR